jgi:two-component system response regulator AtoC
MRTIVDMRKINVLLVDNEKKFLDSIAQRIQLKGFESVSAESGEEALKIARKRKFQAAVVDLKMPGMDGLTTIAKLKEIDPGMKTILLTGYGNKKVKEAAEALDSAYFEKDEMKAFWDFIKQFNPRSGMIIIPPPFGEKETGAWDYNGESGSGQRVPRFEPIEMYASPQSVQRRSSFMDPQSGLFSDSPLHKFIGETASILEVKQKIQKVASLDCPVLFRGESGTGKGLAAKTIHMLSPRKENPFISVNCGSFHEEVLQKELFGQEKEASLGILHLKQGVFELAYGGTILLAEIDDTPISIQDGLLRVLQEQTITRNGGTEKISVDVRILAATERSLENGSDGGNICSDLFSTLNTFIINLPPLRERREDIPLLSSYFLDQYRREFGKKIKGISDEFLSVFHSYPFPGNIRELENAIERAVIVCEGEELKKEHLPQSFQDIKKPKDSKEKGLVTLAELNEQYILEVMRATKGNKSEAARILGINRGSLWRKLKEMQY